MNLIFDKKRHTVFFENFNRRNLITSNLFSKFCLDHDSETTYEILRSSMGVDRVMAILPQHQDTIKICHNTNSNTLSFRECDGLIAATEDKIGLICRTADCPIVMLSSKSEDGVIALIHSGRESTKLDIIGQAIHRLEIEFFLKPSDITAAIWPGICSSCYRLSQRHLRDFPDWQYLPKNISLADIILRQLLEMDLPRENILLPKNFCSAHSILDKDWAFSSYSRSRNLRKILQTSDRNYVCLMP